MSIGKLPTKLLLSTFEQKKAYREILLWALDSFSIQISQFMIIQFIFQSLSPQASTSMAF